MGLVIHMHQSLAISQTATWSTVNAVPNPLFAAASPMDLHKLQVHQSLQLCPPALLLSHQTGRGQG